MYKLLYNWSLVEPFILSLKSKKSVDHCRDRICSMKNYYIIVISVSINNHFSNNPQIELYHVSSTDHITVYDNFKINLKHDVYL